MTRASAARHIPPGLNRLGPGPMRSSGVLSDPQKALAVALDCLDRDGFCCLYYSQVPSSSNVLRGGYAHLHHPPAVKRRSHAATWPWPLASLLQAPTPHPSLCVAALGAAPTGSRPLIPVALRRHSVLHPCLKGSAMHRCSDARIVGGGVGDGDGVGGPIKASSLPLLAACSQALLLLLLPLQNAGQRLHDSRQRRQHRGVVQDLG